MATIAPRTRHDTASLPVAAVLLALLAYGVASSVGLTERWSVSVSGLGALTGWLALGAFALPLMRAPPFRRMTILLLAAAVALRLGFALLVFDRAPQGDAQSYLTLAANLQGGHGLTIAEPFLGIATRALFPPLYPVLLAGWSIAFGFSTPSLLALGTLIDLATAAMLVVLAARLGNASAGRGAAWLYLIWPSVLFSAPLAQKESLCALLVLILATVWVWDDRSGMKRTAVLGIAAGLLALT